MPVHDNDKAKLMVVASTTKIRMMIYADTQNGNDSITRFFQDTLPSTANLSIAQGNGYNLPIYARVYSTQEPNCPVSDTHNLSKLRNRLEFMAPMTEEIINNAIGSILKDLGLPEETVSIDIPVFDLKRLAPRNYVTIIPDIDLTVEQAIQCLSNFIEFTNDIRTRSGLPLSELVDTYNIDSLPIEAAVSHGLGFFGRFTDPQTGTFDPATVSSAPSAQLAVSAPSTGVVVSHGTEFLARRTRATADAPTGGVDAPTLDLFRN